MSTVFVRNGRSALYLDAVPADDLGVPKCGANPSAWYPGGCTLPVHDEKTDHANPNWSGHVEVRHSTVGLELDIRHSHGPSALYVRTKEDGDFLLAWLKDMLDEQFAPKTAP